MFDGMDKYILEMDISMANVDGLNFFYDVPQFKDKLDSGDGASYKNAVLVAEVVVPSFAWIEGHGESNENALID